MGRQSSLEHQIFYFFANGWISQSDHCNFDYPKMPRISKRASLLKEYEALAKGSAEKAYIRSCFDEEDSFEDEIPLPGQCDDDC